MKNIKCIATAALAILAISISAQEKIQEEEIIIKEEKRPPEVNTIFGGVEQHGGFGGVSVMYSEIAGQEAISIGGRGGYIINHVFSIGMGGTGYFNNMSGFGKHYTFYNHAGGHGGLYLEPILLPKFPVHLSVPILLGAGGISYMKYDPITGMENEYQGVPIEVAPYFILEPGVEMELNMMEYFRFALGAYYRLTTNISINSDNHQGNPLEGIKFGMTIKFGKF